MLLSVNTGDDEETFRREVEKLGVDWTVAWQGPDSSPIADLFRVRAYPTTLVIDAEGHVRSTSARGDGIERMVAELLAEPKVE